MKKIILSVLALIIAVMSTAVAVFGWLAVGTQIELNYSGSVLSNYFASGDGSESSPYEINRPNHLYNLVWLQNNGEFNKTDESGNVKQYYFKITNDLDMTGYVLPPIGTKANPFVGILDGGSKTISNLTVSNVRRDDSKPNEVFRVPKTYNEIGDGFTDIVGFFGVIGHYPTADACPSYTKTVNVSNLYLDNLTVRTRTTNSLIGLFAGYVCGQVKSVGVYRSMVSIGAGVTAFDGYISDTNQTFSKYSLIGDYDSKNTNWADGSGSGAGGDLVIDPTTNGFRGISNDTDGNPQCVKVDEESIDKAAFYVSQLNYNSAGANGFALYKTIINPGTTKGTTVYNATNVTSYMSIDEVKRGTDECCKIVQEDTFFKNYGKIKNYISISPGDYIDLNNKVYCATIDKNLLTNSIWFKPVGSGNCSIVFMQTNNGKDGSMSIYKFKRKEVTKDDGSKSMEIDTDSIVETKLTINVGNKYVCFFLYKITDEDIKSDYEYCIGRAAGSNTTAGFVYLKLAGINVSGGDDGNTIADVKFVYNASTTSTADYQTLEQFYAFEIVRTATASGVQIYFLMASDGMYYYVGTGTATVNPTPDSATSNSIAMDNYGGTNQPPS